MPLTVAGRTKSRCRPLAVPPPTTSLSGSFCEGLSLCDRCHSFYHDGIDMTVFCLAERDHAQRFHERFGGEFIEPKNRPKWPGSHR
jgi:hypothetical protein